MADWGSTRIARMSRRATRMSRPGTRRVTLVGVCPPRTPASTVPSPTLDDPRLVALRDRAARLENIGEQRRQRPMTHRRQIGTEILAARLVEAMTGGADASEHLASARGVTLQIERGGIAGDDGGALVGTLLEQRRASARMAGSSCITRSRFSQNPSVQAGTAPLAMAATAADARADRRGAPARRRRARPA